MPPRIIKHVPDWFHIEHEDNETVFIAFGTLILSLFLIAVVAVLVSGDLP